MIVETKKLHPNAQLPFKTHESDFCYDCVATSCEEIAPNVYKYGIGLAFDLQRSPLEAIVMTDESTAKGFNVKDSFFVLDLDFRPRSSVWKTGMVLSNCTGTIDEDYRGEVSAVFYHVMPNMPKYEVGDRIGQLKLGITLPLRFVEVDKLSDTVRGKGGYGSTGK